MPSTFMQKVAELARSPQGRKVAHEAKRLGKDPATRRRIDEARRRLMHQRGRPV